jgi:hypothetical protein
MKADQRQNLLLALGIIVGTPLLIGAVVSGINSSAPEVFQGICSLIGGAIGAGGAALAVYLALNLQHQDITQQILKGLYLEIANYLSSCLTYHGLLTHGLKGHSPEWMLGGMINLPTPLIFPLMANNITLLTEPALVTSFYDRIHALRDTAEKTLVPRGQPLTPVQMRTAVLSLFFVLQSGLKILQSSDFSEVDTSNRTALIERLEREIAGSPVAPMLASLEGEPQRRPVSRPGLRVSGAMSRPGDFPYVDGPLLAR